MKQIAHIEGDSLYSCYWIFPEHEHGVALNINNFSDHMRFLIHRHRAMQSGAVPSVVGMYKLLLPLATARGYSESQLRKQLSKEYGFALDRASINNTSTPNDFTDYEKEMAMTFARQHKFAQLKVSGKMMTLRPAQSSRAVPISGHGKMETSYALTM
jgi:hypothetical protein